MLTLEKRKKCNGRQGCALAKPGGPYRLTFAPAQLENLSFRIEIIIMPDTMNKAGSEQCSFFSLS